MGVYLSKPAIQKELEEGSNAWCQYAVAQMQGWRMSMEDAHVVELHLQAVGPGRPPPAFFAVFDGHGGCEVAKFAAKYMAGRLVQTAAYQSGDLGGALSEVFIEVDELLLQPESAEELAELKETSRGVQPTSSLVPAQSPLPLPVRSAVPQREACTAAGTTVVAALAEGDSVWLAHVGDSRAVLCEGGVAFPLTRDHTPELATERQRLEKAGGFVANNRVNGRLAVTRALGDMEFKDLNCKPHDQVVLAVPEVSMRQLTSASDFLILACDGIWEVLSDQEAVDVVRTGIEGGKSLSAVAALLCDSCLAPTRVALKGCGLDNMTVIIVQFRHPAEGDGPFIGHQHQQQKQHNSEGGLSSIPDVGLNAS